MSIRVRDPETKTRSRITLLLPVAIVMAVATCGDYNDPLPNEFLENQVYLLTDVSCSYGPQYELLRFQSDAAKVVYLERVNSKKYLSLEPAPPGQSADMLYVLTDDGLRAREVKVASDK